jgi:hypothetical protein
MSEGTVPLILRCAGGRRRRGGAADRREQRAHLEHRAALFSGAAWSATILSVGCVGFLKAVNGFDAAYGTQFSTYAVPKIAGEIRRFLRDDGAVKVSRSVKERALRIRLARGAL